MSETTVEALLAAAFGLLIGSFLNVCIYRWPRDLSVVKPRSQCPGCAATIPWFDNIPVLSYAVLGGRCRGCKAPISLQYPIVELLTAGFFGWCVFRYGATPDGARWCVFCAILIALAFTDMETRLLPDQFTLGGLAAGLLFALAIPVPDVSAHEIAFLLNVTAPERLLSLAEGVLGALLPSGALWLFASLYEKVRHKQGLGFGDVLMTAMMGSFLGLKGALLALLIGSSLGSLIGLAYIGISRKDAGSYELPMGTFLAAGGLLFALIGPNLIVWYTKL